ncbi:EcKinase domain containing protein [Asbolus verrucosus]|uniref:EcKinase domain containing protein n=1 Tax=Asbolus verrucosus TaxID=1661398 RepID=A0A482W2N0_ASBVE|nr:EcKinase domain containing protein [Asbolus verrucosus]
MNVNEIKNIENIIPLDEGEKIIKQTVNRLTAPGENYGSLMLSVDITVETQDGEMKEINAVAKMVPPNEFIQKIFNTQVTFRNEIGFYKNIVPTLQNFQREHGVQEVIDFSSKYIGSRINLKDDNTQVDSDAVLLLENLKLSNFKNLERTEGFDLDVSKLVIKDLAYLHGVSLALKLQKPDVFENEVKRFLTTLKMDDSEGAEQMKAKIRKLIESVDGCKPFVSRVMKAIDQPPNLQPREPFATISHNDVWVNNTMIQLDRKKPIKNKLVDFQVCNYGSPAKDLLFFLFSSVKNHILEKHYNDLVQFYHRTFTSVLKELKCDTTQFSFGAFEKELDYEARNSQFGHIVFMCFPIFAPKGSVKDIAELLPGEFSDGPPTELHKQKLAFVIKEFIKRNWI